MTPAPLRLMTIAGTRPEAIKLAPLIHLIGNRPGIEHILIATGQHGRLFHDTLDPFGIAPDFDLEVDNSSIAAFCDGLRRELGLTFARFAPELVIVQGDTSSAWAAAQAAHAAGIPVAHVEAGLRSGDPALPWPEERNRRDIDAISTLLFAPSPVAATNLIGHRGRIHVTGNTGIDAMRWVLDRPRLHKTHETGDERRILVTCHRRESIAAIPALIAALDRIAREREVWIDLPVHPNPAVATAMKAAADRNLRLRLLPALPHADLLDRLTGAYLLLTDSGGLQEEAPALGLPTLVLRSNSERPEPIAGGSAILVGMDEARIVAETLRLLDDPVAHAAMARPAFPYGHGDAARRIVDAILAWAADPVEMRRVFP